MNTVVHTNFLNTLLHCVTCGKIRFFLNNINVPDIQKINKKQNKNKNNKNPQKNDLIVYFVVASNCKQWVTFIYWSASDGLY
jgi:hypothetical protein